MKRSFAPDLKSRLLHKSNATVSSLSDIDPPTEGKPFVDTYIARSLKRFSMSFIGYASCLPTHTVTRMVAYPSPRHDHLMPDVLLGFL